MQAAGAGVGGSQIFSLRSRQNFNPSNPVSWQKKSTIHFSKAPTKTVRAWIPSILGTIHFFIYTSPPPPTHSPPPLRMVGSWIGEFRFAFSKKIVSLGGQKMSFISTEINHTSILIYSPINASFDFKTVDIKKLMITTPKREIIV